jgi:CheY-like chemotaxis protein
MAHELEGKLVLIVEDEADTIDAMAVLLEEAGAIVEKATTLTDAVYVLRESFLDGAPPDAIVCDMYLPDGIAFDLPDELRKLDVSWSGPLVAMSGHPETEAAARRAGFDDFLPKRVSPSLPVMLARILREKGWRGTRP